MAYSNQDRAGAGRKPAPGTTPRAEAFRSSAVVTAPVVTGPSDPDAECLFDAGVQREECARETCPCHSARGLTAGGREAIIELDGKRYTLRITRAGKLILTK